MGYWNYRIIQHGTHRGDTRLYIHYVGYDDRHRITNWSADGSQPTGENMDDLRWDLRYFRQALSRPVLKLHHLEARKARERGLHASRSAAGRKKRGAAKVSGGSKGTKKRSGAKRA